MSLRAIATSFTAVNYQGTWDASSNTPTLTSSVGVNGSYYIVSVAGNTNLNGITNWGVGDWVVFNGSVWERLEGGPDGNFVNLTVSGTTTLSGLTASKPVFTDASDNLTSSGTVPINQGGTGVTTSTGSGSNVLNTSPTLTTPAITGGTISNLTQELIGQSTDQGTGVLQVTGNSSFNGVVVDKTLNLQGGNNLVLNSATLVTQNITVTANTYTLSMTGTGTITLSGTSSGTLVGTGASQVVSRTFTPTAGTLTLTPTGSCTTVQLELGSIFSGYTATTGTAITTTNNINVPSGQVLASAGTQALPAYSFGSKSNTGFYYDGFSVDYSYNGALIGFFNGSGFGIASGVSLAFNSGGGPFLWGATGNNTLEQRNSTNAQTFRLYNTYTSGTSFECLQLDWTTTVNTATISTQKGSGGGTARTLAIGQPLVISTGYTVATLPTGVVGMRAYVTDALVPTYGVAVAGGGAVTIPVFYNGTNWICA